VSETGGTRITARSVSGSSPTSSAATGRPSANATSIRVASCTTWLLVSTNPSGVNTNPEPLPGTSRAGRPRRSTLCRTSTLTTAGPTFSAARGHRPGVRIEQLVVAGRSRRLVGNEYGCCAHGSDLRHILHNVAGFPRRAPRCVVYFCPYGPYRLARRRHRRHRRDWARHGIRLGPGGGRGSPCARVPKPMYTPRRAP